jgi:hypothetical protein
MKTRITLVCALSALACACATTNRGGDQDFVMSPTPEMTRVEIDAVNHRCVNEGRNYHAPVSGAGIPAPTNLPNAVGGSIGVMMGQSIVDGMARDGVVRDCLARNGFVRIALTPEERREWRARGVFPSQQAYTLQLLRADPSRAVAAPASLKAEISSTSTSSDATPSAPASALVTDGAPTAPSVAEPAPTADVAPAAAQ